MIDEGSIGMFTISTEGNVTTPVDIEIDVEIVPGTAGEFISEGQKKRNNVWL